MSDFKGFQKPSQNYSKLPHDLIDNLPEIDSLAELKVVLYILRHTWGFSEYDKPKKMTTDEFANGRKRKDGSRMDGGTGLAANSIRAGLEKAVEHGFITVDIDESDAARIEKWYCLNMSDDSNLESSSSNLDPRPSKVDHRTEKETKERKEQEIPQNMPLDWYIQHGYPVPAELIENNQLEAAATSTFESKLGFGSLPWDSTSEWTTFKKWVMKIHQADATTWQRYAEWRADKGKYDAMSNKQIRQNPKMFIDTGYPAFMAHSVMVQQGGRKPHAL